MTLEITVDQKLGEFSIIETDKKGKVKDAIKIHADKVLQMHQMGQVLNSQVKGAATRRAAFGTFLGMLYNHTRIAEYRGKGDRVEGTMSTTFKAAVRDVEKEIVEDLIDKGHIKVGKTEDAKQQFLSALRADSNYSNAKNTTNRYFSFVGSNCVTQSGFVVPFEVMRKQIADVMEKPAAERTLRAKLMEAKEFMDKNEHLDADDAAASLALCKDMAGALQAIVSHYAELATAARTGVDVAAAAAVEKAASQAAQQPVKPTKEKAAPKGQATV